MTVLAVLTVLAVPESALPSFCLSQATEGGFDISGGNGGFGRDGYPP